MSRVEVYIAVSVTLEDGKVVGAEADSEGAPWAYSDTPQTWNPDTEEWNDSEDAEIDAAVEFLASHLPNAREASR